MIAVAHPIHFHSPTIFTPLLENTHPTPKMPPTLPVYLIHVPKTAGSAIKQTLKTLATTSEAFEGWKVTNRDGVVIHFIARGHCRVRDFPRPARGGPRALKVATIREPVERFVSAFNFVREGGKHHPNQGAVGQARRWQKDLAPYDTFDAFFADKRFVRRVMGPRGHTHFTHLMDWVQRPQPGQHASGKHTRRRRGRRGQRTSARSGRAPLVTDVDFVIRQTAVDADFARLCALLRIDLPASYTIKPFNVTGTKSPVSPEVRPAVEALLKADIRLYHTLADDGPRERRERRTAAWGGRELGRLGRPSARQTVAIDCGGVLSHVPTDRNASLAAKIMAHPATPECVAAVRAIVRAFGPEHVYILSKCEVVRNRHAMVVFLHKSGFFAPDVGLLPHHVLFCSQRRTARDCPADVPMVPLSKPKNAGDFQGQLAHWPDAAKGPLTVPQHLRHQAGKGALARAFGITTLIDDKRECLDDVRRHGVDTLLHACWKPRAEQANDADARAGLVRCADWGEVLGRLGVGGGDKGVRHSVRRVGKVKSVG